MAQPPISTLIVASGDSTRLRECLAIVREQALPLASEVVVVLNTAPHALPADGQRALLRLCDRLEFESTIGKSHALNRGVRACRGEVVTMTDEDARPAADWLRSITEPLLNADRVDGLVGCGGKVIPIFPENGVPDWFSELVGGKPTSFLGPRHDLGDESGDYGPTLPGGRAPIGANCAYLRSVLLRHPYDPTLGPNRATGLLGGEDVELGRRLLSKGHRLRYLPGAEVQHPVRLERATLEYAMRGYFAQGVERVRTLRSLGLPTPSPSRLRTRLWRNRLLCTSLCLLSPTVRIRYSLRGQLYRGMLAELDGRSGRSLARQASSDAEPEHPRPRSVR